MTASQRDLDPDDGLRVRGGAGGTAALLDDLDEMAQRLLAAGDVLAEAAAVLLAVAADPALVISAALAPGTGMVAEASVVAAAVGPGGVVRAGAAAAGLGTTLRGAVQLYRTADALAARTVQALAVGVGVVAPLAVLALGAASPSLVPSGVAVLVDHGPELLQLIGRVPGAGDLAGATVPGVIVDVVAPAMTVGGLAGPVAMLLAAAAVPHDQRRLARAVSLGASGTPYLRETGQVRTRTGVAVAATPAPDLRTLIERTGRLSPGRGGAAGAIQVERITGRDGARAWVVLVPGTQAWHPRTGGNPFDLGADVAAVGGRSTAAGALVVRAVRQCGARPDEPVLIVGHSLGGIVAVEVAADPQVRRDLRITHVVTAGSPIGRAPVPGDVQVLALEHDLDPVPWADGTANPDRPGWVTVSGAGSGADAGAAHEAETYARTAGAVDRSHDPGLVRAREGLAPFLDRPGAHATVWQVEGERWPASPVPQRSGGPAPPAPG